MVCVALLIWIFLQYASATDMSQFTMFQGSDSMCQADVIYTVNDVTSSHCAIVCVHLKFGHFVWLGHELQLVTGLLLAVGIQCATH